MGIFISFIVLAKTAYTLPAEDVEIINNRDYFPSVHELFKNAKKSIYVIMFSAYYYDDHPNSPSNLLLKDLADAKKRGLDVMVILDQCEDSPRGFLKKKKIQPEGLEGVVKFLEKNGIPYKLDKEDVTTHAKLIIVDEMYTVIGSTNWSYSALKKNNETAVIIKSDKVAGRYVDYLKNIMVR